MISKFILTNRKVVLFCNIIKIMKNWHVFILDYLNILDDSYTIYRFRNGANIKVKNNTLDRNIIYEIWIQNIYNPKEFKIEDNDVIIDIGAHKGFFSIFAAMSAKGVNIYGYEPFPENFKILKENIRLNEELLLKNSSSINAFNYAIFRYNDKKKFYVSKKNTGGHSLYESSENNFIEVNCKMLTDILVENSIKRVNFLKLDCEGCEYDILINLSKENLMKFKKIVLEYHFNRHKDIAEYLKKSGFEVYVKMMTESEGMIYSIQK